MATLYLSKRDQRREQKLRAGASTVPSEVSELEDYVAEDETHADIKKAKTRVTTSESDVDTDVTEVPLPTLTLEFRCVSRIV